MGMTESRSCGKRWTCTQVWILAAIVLCLKLPESPFLCQSQEVPGRLDEVGPSSADTESYSGVAIVGFTLNFPELGVIFDSRYSSSDIPAIIASSQLKCYFITTHNHNYDQLCFRTQLGAVCDTYSILCDHQ